MSSYPRVGVTDSERAAILGLALAVVLFLAFATGVVTHRFVEGVATAIQPRPLGVFWEAWHALEEDYFWELPSPRERTYGAIRGTLALLDDPHTVFLEPQPSELEHDQLQGAYGGVGVALWRDESGQIVLDPYPDGPAARAGVREGDILLAVNGESVTSAATVDELTLWLRGEVGTQVTLMLSRSPVPPFNLTLTRELIETPSVMWRLLEQDARIGYLHIETFTERTADEMAKALEELQGRGATRLILDLRDNGGGLLDPAVVVASQFLDGGAVLHERRRGADTRTCPVLDGGQALDIPLVVLVNGGTASAAEIVAGALQDHGRAPLIGEPTFGKGSVQLIYELSDGSSVHITSAIWLTPHHHQINGQGLTPDVIVPQSDEPEDAQLESAIAHLQGVGQESE